MTAGSNLTVRDLSQSRAADMDQLATRIVRFVVESGTVEAQRLVTANTVTVGQTGEFKGRSEAGEPPFQDTGRLSDSLGEAADVRRSGPVVVGIIGSTVKYAEFLELGTKRMKARPFLRPAIQVMERTIEAELARKFSGVFD